MSHFDEFPDAMQGLVALGRRNDLEMRPVLLRVLTDLFVHRETPTDAEARQYEAIATGLMATVDTRTRSVVAGKLALCAAPPAELTQRLLAEGGEVAAAFLARADHVRRDALLAAAVGADAAVAAAVASRHDLDRELVRLLATRREPDVQRALAANFLAPLPREVFHDLVARARNDAALALNLCERARDMREVAPLFLHAAPAHRAAILTALRRGAELTRPPRAPAETMLAVEIERAAIARDSALLSALIARGLSCGLAAARALVEDPNGEPLAMALSALRVSLDAAPRIFMSLDPVIACSHARVRWLSQLAADTPPGVAKRLMRAMFAPQETGARRPARMTVNDPSAASAPSRAGSNARPVIAPVRRAGVATPDRADGKRR